MNLLKSKQDGENAINNKSSGKISSRLQGYNKKFTASTAQQNNSTGCGKIKNPFEKTTYSAQHSHLEYPQSFTSKPNIRSTKYSSSNVFPMYSNAFINRGQNCRQEKTVPVLNLSSAKMGQKRNIRQEPTIPIEHVHYSCPCGAPPPPMPPPTDDLWDLQFCRWWGWNWVRKREEMLNQKRADIKAKSSDSKTSVDKKKRKPKRKPRKQNDFRTWMKKLLNKTKNSKLQREEKKQLQNLYDTPCSSVMFNAKCPYSMNDCRSIKLKGEYECYCSSSGKSSVSTVLVGNGTRRQALKQNKRKHQSWVFEKSDTSSSEECCPCVSLCPYKGEPSTDESVEYLSLRLAQLKSDSEDNFQLCPCLKLKGCKNCPKFYRIPKKNIYRGCPCRVKFAGERYKRPRQKAILKEPERYCECRTKPPSPSRSLPVCRTAQPVKVPQLRKSSPIKCVQSNDKPFPAFKRCLKRKYIPDCCYKGNKEYILYCPCQLCPKKRVRKGNNERNVYHCCCCCRCCHCKNKKELPGNQSESTDNCKMVKLKCKEENYDCSSTQDIMKGNNPNLMKNTPAQYFGFTPTPTVHKTYYFQGNSEHGVQPFVSHAFDRGFYVSPLTGKTYTLQPQVFATTEVSKQSNLPKPMDLQEQIFTFNFSNSPLVDEEHKSLLNAVCEAILTSRAANKKPRQSQTEISYSRGLSSSVNLGSVMKHRPPTLFGASNINKNREHLDCKLSEEIRPNNYESDQSKINTEKAIPRKIISSDFHGSFALSKTCDDKKAGDYTNEVSKPRYDTFANNPNRFNFNGFNFASKNKTDPLQCKDTPFSKLTSSQLFQSSNSNSFKTRIPIRKENSNLQSNNEKLLNFKNLLEQKEHSSNNLSFNKFTGDNNADMVHKSELQDLKHQDNKNDLINLPFNSPQHWTKPPNMPGVSLTGLFSSVATTKDAKNYESSKHKFLNNTKQIKRRRIYNVFFSNDKPDLSDDFTNIPVNFRPKHLINRLPNGPLVVQELPPSDVSHETQTQASSSIELTDNESETELQCVNLDKVQPCKNNATNTKGNTCAKAQKPICPTHAGVNTMLSSVRDVVFVSDDVQSKNIAQSTSFVRKENPEQETGCINCDEGTSKNILHHANKSRTEIKDTKSSCLFLRFQQQNTKVKDSNPLPESTCFFLGNQKQEPNPFTKDKSRQTASVINKIPEELVENIISKTDVQTSFSETSTPSYSSLASGPLTNRYTRFERDKASTSMYSTPRRQTVDATTSQLKSRYITTRRDDRSLPDFYNRRKLAKRESTFSMFCKPVMSKNIKSTPADASAKGSISRPERKMVIKSLKEREKRWRY